jgi:hypothetical protein
VLKGTIDFTLQDGLRITVRVMQLKGKDSYAYDRMHTTGMGGVFFSIRE